MKNNSAPPEITHDFNSGELLTPKEFGLKMKIAETTVREWISNGELVDGKHYIRKRSVVRILWPTIIIIICREALESKESRVKKSQDTKTVTKEKINLGYGK